MAIQGIESGHQAITGLGSLPVTATGSTTPRTLQARAADVANAKDFGVNGDGVADDTAAIVAAIASLPTAGVNPGGIVTLPAGTFRITTPITVPSNVTIIGAGNGPNTTPNQGVTSIDAGAVTSGFILQGTNTRLDGIAIKNASASGVKLDGARFCTLDRIGVWGSSPIGIYLTNSAYFNTITTPNVNGLSSGVGIQIDGGSNENSILRGVVRQNLTNVKIFGDANNTRIYGVDMEGSNTQTGIDIASSASADVVAIGNRFEGLAIGIKIGTSGYLKSFGNYWAATTVIGIQDNSSAHNHAIIEPTLYNCGTPGVTQFFMSDPSLTGFTLGATKIQNVSGGSQVGATGKLVLSTTSGNAVFIGSNAALVPNRVTLTYSATIAVPANQANAFNINASNGSGFTISNPTGAAAAGHRISIMIANTSGGALGTATWSGQYKMSTWTQPANGFNRSISFMYDGSNWYEESRTPADVPN